MKKAAFAISTSLGLVFLSACNGTGTSASSIGQNSLEGMKTNLPIPSFSPNEMKKDPRNFRTDVMLFTGDGSWATEVYSLEDILSSNGASYEEVDSDQLDAMSVDEISQYGLVLFPGGMGGEESGSLSTTTHANLREAVQEKGVSYLGICAGAFIAVAPAPAAGQDVNYGLGVVNGPSLNYYHLEDEGTDIAMTLYSFADGKKADILWYGGPITPNIPGGVIAKYPDGNPAITQMWSGKGFVMLVGGHPTATEETLDVLGVSSSDGTHQDIAWNLIDAAIHRNPMKAF